MNRELIYSRLFDLVASNTGVISLFKIKSRTTKFFDDVPLESCPALFLLETGESWARQGKGMPPKRTLQCKFLIYTLADPTTELQSTMVNSTLDVIDSALETTVATPAITLGGLVEHVYIEGQIVIDEGLLQSKSISVIPITILVP